MISKNRKKLDKIYNQIDKIAKKGKDNIFEYYKFVDDIINKGEFEYFEESLAYFYEIESIDSKNIESVKKDTWKKILFQTNSTFLTKLKSLYDSKGVYQISFNIYSDSGTSSIALGQIKEIDSYSDDYKFLVQNKEFAKLMNSKTTSLVVTKDGEESIIDTNDTSITYDQNLLNNYSSALDILLT